MNTSKTAINLGIVSALGLAAAPAAEATNVLSWDLRDFDNDGAISGFAFSAAPDGINPEIFGAANDGATGAPGDIGCKFSSTSPLCEPIAFDTGGIRTRVFSTGFNFGGTGRFQPMIASAVDLSNNPVAGNIAATLTGPAPTDLNFTSLDFAGFYNGLTFFLPPDALQNCTGNAGCGTTAGTGSVADGFGYNIDSLVDLGGNAYGVVARWVATINDSYSPFHGFEANWRVEGIMTVGDHSAVPIPAAGYLFASGLAGLAGLSRRRKKTA